MSESKLGQSAAVAFVVHMDAMVMNLRNGQMDSGSMNDHQGEGAILKSVRECGTTSERSEEPWLRGPFSNQADTPTHNTRSTQPRE